MKRAFAYFLFALLMAALAWVVVGCDYKTRDCERIAWWRYDAASAFHVCRAANALERRSL